MCVICCRRSHFFEIDRFWNRNLAVSRGVELTKRSKKVPFLDKNTFLDPEFGGPTRSRAHKTVKKRTVFGKVTFLIKKRTVSGTIRTSASRHPCPAGVI